MIILDFSVNERIKNVGDGNIPRGYKKTRVGVIPIDWDVKKLSDVSIGKGIYGIGAPAVEFREDLPRYLRITDISDNGTVINDDKKSVNHPDSYKYILKENDIVFARTGNTTGKSYLYKKEDGELVYAGFLIKFSIDPNKASAKFIHIYTQTTSYWNWVKVMSARSGQPGINENEYGKLPIPYPKLEEQHKIAEILSTWERAIELKEKLIEQKKLQKKGLMQKLLTGKVRLPGFDREWIEIRLKELIKEVNEKTTINNQYEVLSVTKNGIVPQKEHFNKQVASEDNTGYKIVRKNNLVFSTMNLWMGSLDVLTTYEIGIVSPAYKVFEFVTGKFDPIFGKYFMQSEYMIWLYNVNSEQGASIVRRNLDLKGLLNSVVKIPPLDEQVEIANILVNLDREIKLLEQELEALKQQKKGLMQLVLTGKVRVKV